MQRAIKIRLLPTKEQEILFGKVQELLVGLTITFLMSMKKHIKIG